MTVHITYSEGQEINQPHSRTHISYQTAKRPTFMTPAFLDRPPLKFTIELV
jgi:hypothetical protein